MAEFNPFDDALDEALRQSEAHDAALALVEELTKQLSNAVRRKTQDKVRVEVVSQSQAVNLGSLFSNLWMLDPTLGEDKEDRVVRQYIVARAGEERRALWAITYSDAGYPVTLRGPEPESSTTCFSDEDVQQVFMEAVRHGRVGRKIANLAKLDLEHGVRALSNDEDKHPGEAPLGPDKQNDE